MAIIKKENKKYKQDIKALKDRYTKKERKQKIYLT